ncbi:MAG: IclR family transcriptional regulator [Pannonibacter indicus]
MPALRRTVMVMDLIASSTTPLTAADITRALKLPKSTAHGLFAVMQELNLLVKKPDGTFRLGPHPLRWANSFLSELDVLTVFRSYFAKDTAFASYTLTLTVLDGQEVVYIGCRNSDQPLGHTFRIGMRLPAPFTATGKMLLSELSPEELQRLFGSGFPEPMTQHSVKDLASLRQELAETAARGYSIDNGQIREGMICLGAALRDHSGEAIAGIAISLLRSEATAEAIADLGERIRTTAADVSRHLGHHGR